MKRKKNEMLTARQAYYEAKRNRELMAVKEFYLIMDEIKKAIKKGKCFINKNDILYSATIQKLEELGFTVRLNYENLITTISWIF